MSIVWGCGGSSVIWLVFLVPALMFGLLFMVVVYLLLVLGMSLVLNFRFVVEWCFVYLLVLVFINC